MSIKEKYTDDEIQQLEDLVRELYKINEELNARCIAFHAKLLNEEAKVRRLTQILNESGYNIKPIYVTEDGLEVIKSTIPI